MSEKILYLTDDTFEEEVLKSAAPVLVDYWAEWCGPCKMIAPILDEIASEYTGKIKVAKLNIDDNPQTPPRYGIRGIPTLMLFKDGNVEATKVVALSKSQLTAFIESNISEQEKNRTSRPAGNDCRPRQLTNKYSPRHDACLHACRIFKQFFLLSIRPLRPTPPN